jgi:hypothetical protein
VGEQPGGAIDTVRVVLVDALRRWWVVIENTVFYLSAYVG